MNNKFQGNRKKLGVYDDAIIDLDIYQPNKIVEDFIQSLKAKFGKDSPTTKIYISTVNPCGDWLKDKCVEAKKDIDEVSEC